MKIGLQNFQGVGAYIEIPIAPITLFYGPNSAGKSTVADAIEFLHRTLSRSYNNFEWRKQLERHARSNRRTQPLKKNFKGKPDDVVFKASGTFSYIELINSLIGLDISNEWFDSKHKGLREVFYPNGDTNGAQFEYQINFTQPDDSDISWDVHKEEKGESWYLRETQLSLGSIPLFRVNSEDCFGTVRIAFNINHPSWDKLDNQFEGGFILALYEFYPEDEGGIEESDVDEINRSSWLYFDYHQLGSDFFLGDRPLSVDPDHWPYSGQKNDPYSSESRAAIEFINLFMLLPARSVARSWSMVTVQPIRSMPEGIYELDWYSHPGWSLECWEQLAKGIFNKNFKLDASALDFVNHALLSPDFLETGYAITGDVKLLLEVDDAINNLPHLDHVTLLNKLSKKAARVHPYLIYQPNNFPVEIADVGVGISQVIPVLWACWRLVERSGVVHIQQPELHLHPKLQAQLADVFIKALHERPVWEARLMESLDKDADTTMTEEKLRRKFAYLFEPENADAYFLIESHSEHMLLRLLRRIRETNQTKASTKEVVDLGKARSRSLNANQVSVVYVKKDKNGLAEMKHLRLAEDGEFLDRWPDGFFAERDIELFGEEAPFA